MEEQVGELWHKILDKVNDKTYPQEKVKLKEIKPRLLIYFKALTRNNALSIELADKRKHLTQRNWIQKVAASHRSIIASWRNRDTLYLPAEIAYFNSVELNEKCYFWLAGMSALATENTLDTENWLQYNQQLCAQTLKEFSGLKKTYEKLIQAHIKSRPLISSLNNANAKIELTIRDALLNPHKKLHIAPEKVQPGKFQPAHVPLWLYQPLSESKNTINRNDNNNQHTKKQKEVQDMVRKKAREVESTEETTGLITVRMENIFSWGEHAAVDRSMDDEDDLDNAENAAKDMDEIAVTQNQRAAVSSLKFDLDLPSACVDDEILSSDLMLPEWNYKKAELIDNHCRIIELETKKLSSTKLPEHLKQTAKKLRNQFQALAPAREWKTAQAEGTEIDINRWIQFNTDKKNSYASSDQLYKNMLSGNRDMCCTLLADLSLSTDTWLNNNDRVIDVIRDALLLFGESLQATGDPFSMLGFSSRKRDPIRIHQLKRFNESFNGMTRGRINAIKPGYYTRLGAAIRYTTQQLMKQAQANRLMLILTDGKPNDLDQYEGRYGIEDTRQAILEARRAGLKPFCVTIDKKANEYLPYLFGNQSFVVIKNPLELPKKLPLLYAQLSSY